jgi:hypothetical protein
MVRFVDPNCNTFEETSCARLGLPEKIGRGTEETSGRESWEGCIRGRNTPVPRPSISAMNMLDVYIPILTYLGCNRMQRFIRLMAVDRHTSIIDVGGTPFIWQSIECQPSVMMINV